MITINKNKLENIKILKIHKHNRYRQKQVLNRRMQIFSKYIKQHKEDQLMDYI